MAFSLDSMMPLSRWASLLHSFKQNFPKSTWNMFHKIATGTLKAAPFIAQHPWNKYALQDGHRTLWLVHVSSQLLISELFYFQLNNSVQDLKARPITRSQLDWTCLLTTRSKNLRPFGDKRNGVWSRSFLNDFSLISFCFRFLFLSLSLPQPFANENDDKKVWLFENCLTLELIDGTRFLLMVWKKLQLNNLKLLNRK